MSKQKNSIMTLVLACLLSAPAAGLAADGASKSDKAAKGADQAKLARGKYLVKIAGCNDCHTPGYMVTAGKVEEKLWLTGESFGWRGPWGTTYAPNLRLYFDKVSEDQWVKIAHSVEMRPPMPWFALRDMTDADLRAIHAYARSLGPAGKPAPAYLLPDKVPPQPYAQFPSPPPAKK